MIARFSLTLAVCLLATSASAGQKEFSASRSETATAKVKKVDAKTREVTLGEEDGSETIFKAGPEVRNFEQLKKGDLVEAKFDQTLTLWLLDKDQAAPELGVGADVYRAKPGEKPGGSMTADVTGVATVEELAPDRTWVKLKGPRGNVLRLDVKVPANLEGVNVGQRVGFAYSETLAISVTPAKKK